MQFQKAQRHKAKLRLGITGPSGSGKTWGALMIAKGLGGKVAVIDTERGSASLYSHLADFDVAELGPPYTPERFIESIKAAEAAGYDTLIIDSTTHEWNGIGGCLELVDHIAGAKYRGNSWSAWNEVTPRHRAFIDAMLRSSMHVIVTMRSKTETAQVEENGRKKVVKLGMKAEQRDGVEYELTTVLDLTHEKHYALASKDRTGLFAGDPEPITEATGARLLAWLESGATLRPAPPKAAPEPSDGSIKRLSSSQAKEIGLNTKIRESIEKIGNLADLVEWEAAFDYHTAECPGAWLDSIRNQLVIRRGELMGERAPLDPGSVTDVRGNPIEEESDTEAEVMFPETGGQRMAGREGHLDHAA